MAALCMKQVSALYVALVPKHALATVQITTRTLSRSAGDVCLGGETFRGRSLAFELIAAGGSGGFIA